MFYFWQMVYTIYISYESLLLIDIDNYSRVMMFMNRDYVVNIAFLRINVILNELLFNQFYSQSKKMIMTLPNNW